METVYCILGEKSNLVDHAAGNMLSFMSTLSSDISDWTKFTFFKDM